MKLDHAIVLGGGCAGMLAAKVLAERFKRVTIVERTWTEERLPQSAHLHVLLKRGQNIIADLLPGIVDDFMNTCPSVDWGYECDWVGPSGSNPRYASGVITYLMSRGHLDRLMQRHIRACKNIFYADGEGDIIFNNTSDRAIGVSIATELAITKLYSDLIVDARGRSSDLGRTLRNINITIERQFLPSTISYSTRIFREQSFPGTIRQRYVQIRPQVRDRGIVISPIEDEKATVTLIYDGHAPPMSKEAFKKALIDMKPYTEGFALDDPCSSVFVFRNFSGRRYVFRSASSWPRGLIVLGDAACIVNPVYGQGMSIAASQALLLRQYISHSSWEARFQRAIDDTTYVPWLLGIIESREMSDLPLGLRLFRGYFDRIIKQSGHDHVVHRAFLRAMHLLDPPYALIKPDIVLRAMKKFDHRKIAT